MLFCYIFQSQADFHKNSLDCIDDTLISVINILKDITDDRMRCLKELSERQNFVLWVKDEIEGTVATTVCSQ